MKARPTRRALHRTFMPLLTVRRLSLYLRYLEGLTETSRRTVSSRQLGQDLGLTDAQVRKDLGYFGHFGRPGVGYDVPVLAQRLRAILGTDRIWSVVLVGAGSLGSALLRYRGFFRKGFRIAAAFDAAPGKVGRKLGEVVVRPMSELGPVIRRGRIRLGIIATPAQAGQKVADALCRAGVKGILNFAPVTLSVPRGVGVVPVDLAVQLELLSYLVRYPARKRPSRRTTW
jgi:redox-sensing transcriptional repressor